MNVQRYSIVQAVKTKDNELIPIWDERISFEKSEHYGNVLNIKDQSAAISYVVEAVYDLKTKTLSCGIELNYYPNEKELEYKKGEDVLYEVSNRKLGQAKIVDIIFEEFDMEIIKGKKVDKYWKERFKDIDIENNKIYAIKTWKPFYVLDNGIKIDYTFKLFHKV
jgi:hypothetical protein